MKKYFVYILKSQKILKWYIGHTNNIQRRLSEHNSGQNKSTKTGVPWKLIFLREFRTNIEANGFEIELKRTRNKDYIRSKYKEYFLDS